MKETQVWSKFKLAWPYHADRQEPGIGAGQPDVILLDRIGCIGLVELKAPDDINLNPNQWIWHEIWWANNGRTVVVSCQDYGQGIGLVWRVFVPVFKPRRLKEITEQPRDRLPRAAMSVIASALRLYL